MSQPPQSSGPESSRSAGARRRTSSMTSVQDCLRRPKGRLAQLVAQTDRLARVNRAFRAYLPPHLHDHARLSQLSSQNWVVQTESAVWATRLRYALPSLRQQLSEHLGYEVPNLVVKVKPAGNGQNNAPPRRMKLTEESANFLEGAAEGVSDQRLGAALMRLAQHAKQR